MAFFDDDLDPAPAGPGPRRGGSDPQRQIFLRRLIALGAGVLILILLLLGIRGCLDARKERGFENYVSDLGSIVTTSNQLSGEFFTRLRTPPERSSPLNLETDIASDRGTVQGLLSRVEGLDTPDDLAGAQSDLVKAYELRLEAFTGISESIPTALGEEGRTEAIDAIVADMRILLASDVLYEEAHQEITDVLASEEINARIEESVFLPPPVEDWLSDEQLTLILSGFAADSCDAGGDRGLELVGVSADRTPLVAGSENTIEVGGGVELEAEVSNPGSVDEVDVPVTAEISGPTGLLEAENTISRIEPLQIGSARLTFETDPPLETPLSLEVTGGPVLCETLLDNNTLTYTVTFE